MSHSIKIVTHKLCESYKKHGVHSIPFQLFSCKIAGWGVIRTVTLPHFFTINFLLQLTNTNSWRLKKEPPSDTRCSIKGGHRPLYVVLSKVGDHLVCKYSGKRIELKLVKMEPITAIQSVNRRLISVSLGDGMNSPQNEEQRILNRTISGWDRSVFSPLLSHFLMKQERSRTSTMEKRNRFETKSLSPPSKKRRLTQHLSDSEKAVQRTVVLGVQHDIGEWCVLRVDPVPVYLENKIPSVEKQSDPMNVDHERRELWETREDPFQLHCICRKPDDGTQAMICCDSCHIWFHGACIGLSDQKMNEMGDQNKEYICSKCQVKNRDRNLYIEAD